MDEIELCQHFSSVFGLLDSI